MPKDDRQATPISLAPERASGEMPRISGLHPAQGASLDEELDLTAEQQARITAVFSRLDSIDLYQLLGVPRDADKKTLKRAYNARVMDFHPDRFFRKRLGTFKPKMEAIFARMTDALDVLCSPERRAEYDETTPQSDPRQDAIDAMLEAELAGMPEDDGRYERFDFEAAVPVTTTPPPPPLKPSVAPFRAPVAMELEERRKTLARKLSIRPAAPKKT